MTTLRFSWQPLAAALWLALALSLVPWGARAAAPTPVAVAELDYLDSSGEPRDQQQVHAARTERFTADLRRDLAASGKYRIVTPSCGDAPCRGGSTQPAELIEQAQKAGARLLLIGGVHKMSTLVQWAKVEAVDLDSQKVVFDRLLTFRGDTDEAWARVENFLAQDLISAPPVAP